ncbi:MAG: hypothetical protein U5K43_15480 [Halofilum sp. (in: g-proteobacteria)]|nr:hypothetical protein [Halofilum sp. (in: g-proteobacteria)]
MSKKAETTAETETLDTGEIIEQGESTPQPRHPDRLRHPDGVRNSQLSNAMPQDAYTPKHSSDAYLGTAFGSKQEIDDLPADNGVGTMMRRRVGRGA